MFLLKKRKVYVTRNIRACIDSVGERQKFGAIIAIDFY
uniref:Uncharacterized protein n=1 Tax=Lepeophtheirus salmonis TaxID=72036 RepID=A0A0K2UJT3_LEPSM